MAKMKPVQEKWNPGELWVPEESVRNRQEDDPLYRSGVAQREIADAPRGQKRTGEPRRQADMIFQEPRSKTEATNKKADKGPRRQTAAISEKRGDIQLDQ
jgi:hypothetical protein